MISKETFVDTINYLKEKEEADCAIQDIITKYRHVYEDGMVPIDMASSVIVKLIEESMGLPETEEYGSTLSWWIWELEFGKKFEVGDVELPYLDENDPNRKPDIRTAEQLYDFLVFEASENARKKEE